MDDGTQTTQRFYIGTYTKRNSKGIYRCSFDSETGRLGPVELAAQSQNPSFLAKHPHKPVLYAVNELTDPEGKSAGQVSAFTMDEESGALAFLNQQSTHGADPCHLTVDATGRYVLVANYTSGSAAVFPVQEDGRLRQASHVVAHQGSSVNPKRQQGPHAHSVTLDPANKHAFVCDLGLDKVMIYRLDLEEGKLLPNEAQAWVRTPAGAGPRHFDFHPNGRFAYVINELDSTVSVFTYDPEKAVLREIQIISTLPEDFDGVNHPADVHVHPNGKFLYGSNRGHDSIVIFAIDEQSGKLSPVGHESTQGRNPRNFVVDPTGRFLLAANQDTDNIVVFRINSETGSLIPTTHATDCSMPVCLLFV